MASLALRAVSTIMNSSSPSGRSAHVQQLAAELTLAERLSGGDSETAHRVLIELEEHVMFCSGEPVSPADAAKVRRMIALLLAPNYLGGGDSATLKELLDEWGSISTVKNGDIDVSRDGAIRETLRLKREHYGAQNPTFTPAETAEVRQLLVALLIA